MTLSAKKVERITRPGRYADTGGRNGVPGLLLQISKSGARSWILRYQLNHAERMMGLGSVKSFNLKEARERARSARRLLADGTDPLDVKRQRRAEAEAAQAKRLTFREAAERFFDQHQHEWRSASHRDQFLTTLATHIYPTLGGMDVAAIDTAAVLRSLEPIWTTKTITADRTRSRVEAVLDWATVRNYRSGDNPARWKGHLDQVLPSPRKTAPVVHHAAMAYAEVPAFMATLRADESIAARALEFLILTAARSGEVRGATWHEIDLDQAVWVIPPSRMKAKREHRVALSTAAVDLLRKLPREAGNDHVFIGPVAGRGLSKMGLQWVMHRHRGDLSVTTHGFRSSFSDWANAETAHSSHSIELCLSHAVGTEVERSYRRGPMLAKRVKLMNHWAKFVTATPRVQVRGSNVVGIGGGR